MTDRNTRLTDRPVASRTFQRLVRLVRVEETDRALARIRQLTRLAQDPSSMFELAALEAECLLLKRQFALFDKAVARIDLGRDVPDKIRVSLLVAHRLVLAGDAIGGFRLVKPLLRRAGTFEEHRARACWIAGLALYRTGHYHWARQSCELAAAYYRLAGDKVALSQILINIALLSKSQGNIVVALAFLDDAAGLLPPAKFRITRLRLFINRGILFHRMGQLDKARDCFLSAQKLSQDSEERVFLAMSYTNLGHVYRALGKYSLAEEFYWASLEIARTERSERQVCLALEFLAENLAEQGRFDEALISIQQAVELASRLAKHGDLMMEILRRRGEIRAGLGCLQDALTDLERALEMCRSRGELREAILTERSSCLLRSNTPLDDIAAILHQLDELGDRFEYSRTVCLILESGRFAMEARGRLASAVARALEHLQQTNNTHWLQRLQTAVSLPAGHERIPGASFPTTQNWPRTNSSLYEQALGCARLAARSDQPALVLGETGSGKEIVSQLIHQWGVRKDKPFVAINCGALPENLFESELFGHARGAFTGADRDKVGLLEMADGGTAFLDEVADLPPHTQVKLLRFLDCGELRRLGDTKVRKLDARIIAATNKSLQDLVRRGRFREDLYYRLNVFQVDVPPLRMRREDIWMLANEFLVQESHSRLPIRVAEDLKAWMQAYDWPGNVRELRNLCRYLSTHAWGKPEIALADLPPNMRSTAVVAPEGATTFEREKSDFERAQILKALQETGGSISAAAKLLGAGRNRLSRRMRDLNIAREDFRL